MNQNISQPIPQGKYLPAVRHDNFIYTSGMTPRKDGVLVYSGKIKTTEPLEYYREAIEIATKNALIAAQATLEKDEKVSLILQLTVYLNAEEDFREHSKMADFASALLVEELGAISIGSRAAIGVSSLPSNAMVEVTLVGAVVKLQKR